MSRTVVLQGRPDSFNSVQGLDCQCGFRLNEATLHLGREGCGMLLRMEGALHVSIDCYNATWSRHLKLEISVVRGCIEIGERGSSK